LRCLIGINPVEELNCICPQGFKRAQWLAGNPSSNAVEEKTAPGCPFGMLTEDSYGYCFFKFIHDSETTYTEEEISRRLCLNLPQVKKILTRSISKISKTEWSREVEELYQAGELFPENKDYEHDNLYYDCSIGSDVCGVYRSENSSDEEKSKQDASIT